MGIGARTVHLLDVVVIVWIAGWIAAGVLIGHQVGLHGVRSGA